MNPDAFEPIVLGAADLGGAARLVEGAGWNQVADDWRIFLDLGRVIGLRAPDGGLAATAAVLPYADGGFGWISMVLVGAGWQRRGLATGLLRTCIETLQAQGLACGLDATPAGRTVYQPLGFRDGWAISRWRRGPAAPAAGSDASASGARHGDERLLPIADEHRAAIAAFDASAFGADRSALLAGLQRRSTDFGCVLVSRGQLRGFLLGRNGRNATQLGPIVASDSAAATRLLDHALQRLPGPLLLDVLDQHQDFADRLSSRGFAIERGYTRMTLGSREPRGDPAWTIAIAGPELG